MARRGRARKLVYALKRRRHATDSSTAAAALAACGDSGTHVWTTATVCLDGGGGGVYGRGAAADAADTCFDNKIVLGGLRQRWCACVEGVNGMPQRRWRRGRYGSGGGVHGRRAADVD